MPSVSAIVLTKNSERTIEACLKALKPAVDHVIVIDTGSIDNTVQIAKDHGALVYYFEWRDDFSAVRNFGDSLATTDWVIHVDSDEILRTEDTNKIRNACSKYKRTSNPVVINVMQHNLVENNVLSNEMARLYKRGVLVWKGIIHEQLIHKRGEPFYAVTVDVGFIHDGYHPAIVNLREKCLRNIRLLQTGVKSEPDNPVYHYFLGREFHIVEEYESAINHLQLSIDLFKEQNLLNTIDDARKLLAQCEGKLRTVAHQQL